ncbi:MAG TPA: hypothetical protein VM510_17800, partial [Caulifigura sp.]|nr:hypothetical protein [Caulifigura sp.]
KKTWDPQLVSRGQIAFQSRCTDCHDANKSLGTSKSLAGWRSTVRRMAGQDGADIPACDWEPIAVYLASLSSPSPGGAVDGTMLDVADSGSDVSVFGTISPTLRTLAGDLQNGGFFPDAWLGVNWQPKGLPISAKATACISCHNESDEGFLSRLELVNAVLKLDIGQMVRDKKPCPACAQWEANVEAGRFVVPFGAFASQVNPGVYRTVSRPLMFNMGQRVFDEQLGDPVLPMPYSDEGANFNISVPVFDDITATMDAYVVNGLQGDDSGISFDLSRDYVDNNRTPAVGGRWTIGNNMLRLGSSLMSGRFNGPEGTGPGGRAMQYSLIGADATFRYQDIFRLQAEFAQRNTDNFVNQPGMLFGTDKVNGAYVEGELWVTRPLSLLLRWDLQNQNYAARAAGSDIISPKFSVQRWTCGINYNIAANSLLMFNIEHWKLPDGMKDLNVVGVRWAASF